jgi:transcriptional regulator with XRE-family HTH domain
MDSSPDRDDQLQSLGAFIRAQRQLANLSLRQMAELAKVSNPYLSQLERGLHEPSLRVLQAIAQALDVSAETLLEHAGAAEVDVRNGHVASTEVAIRNDPDLTDEQKQALLVVYRSYVQANTSSGTSSGASSGASTDAPTSS